MNILIGGAWPYANGSLHIGHIAGLLPGDVIARFHRGKGDEVFFVSGSDCHGTPVAIRAKQENKTPEEVSDFYHHEFCDCFEKLGFRYDLYSKTSSKEHKDFIKAYHEKLYESDYVYEKETPEAFCPKCNTFLADRFVVGTCGSCGSLTRGDQCDACGAVLDTEHILEASCAICSSKIQHRNTKHLYIALSQLEQELRDYINAHSDWRKNALHLSNRYIEEGLRDRALTRDLSWGIEVPKEGYEEKKIYIWAENVLGYLSASATVAKERNIDMDELWKGEGKHYYVHGKDNIPFHTIILPGLLIAQGEGWHLPDEIISSEYLTLEGKKISTSNGYAIWVKDILDRYHPDSIRYYLLANGPEKRDADFSWREFIHTHNSDLVGIYGNFVHRTLTFIQRFLDGVVPRGQLSPEFEEQIDQLYGQVGRSIEMGDFKDGLNEIIALVREGNKYFDTEQPWLTRLNNLKVCEQTIYQCVQLIANIAVLLHPFLPFSSEQVFRWLDLKPRWGKQFVTSGKRVTGVEVLFQRIDKGVIDVETEKVQQLLQQK